MQEAEENLLEWYNQFRGTCESDFLDLYQMEFPVMDEDVMEEERPPLAPLSTVHNIGDIQANITNHKTKNWLGKPEYDDAKEDSINEVIDEDKEELEEAEQNL